MDKLGFTPEENDPPRLTDRDIIRTMRYHRAPVNGDDATDDIDQATAASAASAS